MLSKENKHELEIKFLPYFEQVIDGLDRHPRAKVILLLLLELGIRQEDLLSLNFKEHLEKVNFKKNKARQTWKKMGGLHIPDADLVEAINGYYELAGFLY